MEMKDRMLTAIEIAEQLSGMMSNASAARSESLRCRCRCFFSRSLRVSWRACGKWLTRWKGSSSSQLILG